MTPDRPQDLPENKTSNESEVLPLDHFLTEDQISGLKLEGQRLLECYIRIGKEHSEGETSIKEFDEKSKRLFKDNDWAFDDTIVKSAITNITNEFASDEQKFRIK